MRLVILSDIHGNPIALDAVLADIKSQGKVDAYWVLGDFAALGYDPVTPLEKITALPHASFTRGNTDRYVVTEDLPVPPEKALQDPTLLPEVIEAVRSFSWTRGYLSAAGWLDWLMNVPLEVRVTLPDGTRLLGVHASPGRDDGPGLQPKHSDDQLEQRLAGCEARPGHRRAYPYSARSSGWQDTCDQSGQHQQSGHVGPAGDLCAS